MAKTYYPPIPARDIETVRPAPAEPFVKRFDIGWGDTDPAQIAYTGALPDYAIRAIEAWYKAVLGGNWFVLNMDYGLDTPFVHLSLDFAAPVTPRHTLDCWVYVSRLGSSSIRHRVLARQDGTHCFTCDTVGVFVDRATFESRPMLPNVRATIEGYLARHPVPEAELAA